MTGFLTGWGCIVFLFPPSFPTLPSHLTLAVQDYLPTCGYSWTRALDLEKKRPGPDPGSSYLETLYLNSMSPTFSSVNSGEMYYLSDNVCKVLTSGACHTVETPKVLVRIKIHSILFQVGEGVRFFFSKVSWALFSLTFLSSREQRWGPLNPLLPLLGLLRVGGGF